MKNIITSVFIFIAISAFSQQKNINNYKYVIVPSQFEWTKIPDQFQVNSLTKFLFNKYGFIAFLSEDELPKDLAVDRCLALFVNVKNTSGMFRIKNVIELKDCTNKVLFTSVEGKSNIKEYKKGYHEAIRNAFKSIQSLKYSYVPIKQVIVEVQEETPAIVNSNVKIQPEKEVEVIEPIKAIIKKDENTLYAQEIKNGFQLVNTKPETVFQILKSSNKDFYFLKNKNGILFKENNKWFAEYYQNDVLIKKELNIKF